MVRVSVVSNKLKEELEDVGKVYNSRSGVCVYPNAFSRLQTEIVKVCNVNKELEKENEKLKTDCAVLSCSVDDFGELQDKLEEEQRKNNGLLDKLTDARELILKLYNAGRDVLMCRAEEKAYDNLSDAISDKRIEQFLEGTRCVREDIE